MIKAYFNPVSAKRYGFVLKQVACYANGRNLTILDIGCGMGRLSFPLAEMGHNIVGIDEDTELIRQCNEVNKYPNSSFINMDAHDIKGMPQFDVIICAEVLEHTTSPKIIVNNIEKILKTNGILILTTPNGYCLTEVVLNRLLSRNGKSNRGLKVISRIYCFVTGTTMTHTHPFYLHDLHIQFFSLQSIKELFVNFRIDIIENSDLGLLIPGSGKTVWLKKIECKIADYLPHFMVGGWMITMGKKDVN